MAGVYSGSVLIIFLSFLADVSVFRASGLYGSGWNNKTLNI
jgi:hypothetical protein